MIYQFKYTDKAEAITHLKSVGVLKDVTTYNTTTNDEGEDITIEVVNTQYTAITEAVVYIGLIVDQQGTYDVDGNELTPPTFLDGYHVDVMTNKIVNFGNKEIFPTNERHKFST
tara:strand:+ start:477 stop:818 length:342 start_codon:yes stop_codon:yes gene_type:complete